MTLSRDEILTGLRDEPLTIQAALRQAFGLGTTYASPADVTDETHAALDAIAAKVQLPRLKGAARVLFDSRSDGWTKLPNAGLEIRDAGSTSHTTYIEYRAVSPEPSGSAGD